MTQSIRRDGYSKTSIIVHWLAAIAVIALFVTHEGDRGDAAYGFHVGGGAVIGLFLLWRVWRRVRRGPTDEPDQSTLLNLASKIVIFGFLTAIVIVVISGYLIPWSAGQEINMGGLFTIPSPIGRNSGLHEFMEEVHEVSGQLFVPLLLLHVLGTAKHAFIDKDSIAKRMFRSVAGGR